ncbi:MAG TPA: matrixin family metalloprotease, partial [Polyangiales bacterium]|nr:matrixin family metalloprotease [Polyangiales bacterium]
HEMGHVLGLDESPDDRDSTMWPYIRGGDVHQRSLSEDDEAGIVAAYKDVLFESSLPLGCTQASVLGVIPAASNLRFAAWVFLTLALAQRLSRRRTLAVAVGAAAQKVAPRSKPSPSVRPAFHGNF